VVVVAGLAQTALPLRALRVGVAIILIGLGFYQFVRHRHPRWGGMQVGFGDLTLWSF
jgi:hypothetical protein